MESLPLLSIRGLAKSFGAVPVLSGIDLDFHKGEIHGLLGENGAGKSTLIKILTGVYSATAGELLLDGEPVRIASPLDAHRLGLGAVYQDAELAPSFTVAQNMLLGNELGALWISGRALEERAEAICREIGVKIDVRRKAKSLSAAEMQLVTLATLFQRRYRLIILDEPTARLSGEEADLLFALLSRFRAQGLAIIYISHRLAEIRQICDRATVMRGGLISATLPRTEISEARVTELMVHRSASDLELVNAGLARSETRLELRALRTARLKPISLTLRAGEILGVTGPVGGGMEELEQALGGITRYTGDILLDGETLRLPNPASARAAGIAVVPEDRRKQALFPTMSLGDNIALPSLNHLERLGIVSARRKRDFINDAMALLGVRPNDPALPAKTFSGGNQQKAVIGKWLKADARVYVFNEPTAGVDVGAIRDIHEIILRIAREGAVVVLISTSIREILALSERVTVIREGQIVFDAPRADCTHDSLLATSMRGALPHEAA